VSIFGGKKKKKTYSWNLHDEPYAMALVSFDSEKFEILAFLDPFWIRDPTCYTQTSSRTCTEKRSRAACCDTTDLDYFWNEMKEELLQ
jgi:hypothetical protein